MLYRTWPLIKCTLGFVVGYFLCGGHFFSLPQPFFVVWCGAVISWIGEPLDALTHNHNYSGGGQLTTKVGRLSGAGACGPTSITVPARVCVYDGRVSVRPAHTTQSTYSSVFTQPVCTGPGACRVGVHDDHDDGGEGVVAV